MDMRPRAARRGPVVCAMKEMSRMADVSRHAGDLSQHPDVHEMRERYARVVAGRKEVAVAGLVLLAGLWCATSAWTVHFDTTRPDLMINNLIIGLAVAAIGL